MKQRKQAKILFALLAVSCLCAALLYVFQEKTEAQMPEGQIEVTNYGVGNVQAIVLGNEHGSIGLINTAQGVIVDGDATEKYSQDKLKYLVYSLAHIPAERVVDGQEAENYGFSDPSAQASLLLEDETIRLQLGRQNPLSQEYYIRSSKSDEIYMVDRAVADQMLQFAQDLRDLSLYPPLTDDALAALSEISLENDGGKIVLTQVKSNTHSNFYAMSEPVAAALNWESVDKLILNPLRRLAPVHFVSDDVPLSDYGLDQPECVLELTLGGTRYRCGFVQKTSDVWYCARLDGSLVSEVDAEALPFADLTYLDLIGNTIYAKGVADLSRIGASYEDKRIEITIEGAGTDLTATAGTRQMDSRETIAFYKKIGCIPAAARLQGTESIDPGVILTLSVTARDGTEDIIEFHPMSQRQCAVFINGAADFSTYNTVVTEMIAVFEALNEQTK